MKKKSILLILLLSVQLSGCSNKQPDLPVQEFSLTEENGLKESQTTVEIFRDERTVSATEPENRSESINSADEEKTDSFLRRRGPGGKSVDGSSPDAERAGIFPERAVQRQKRGRKIEGAAGDDGRKRGGLPYTDRPGRDRLAV